MSRIFVSSADVDGSPAAALIRALRAAGVTVSHSPSCPHVRHDPRWEAWYSDLLPFEVANADAFVAVMDLAWTCSTWMGEEARHAMLHFANSPTPRVHVWNPSGFEVPVGMRAYACHRLPDDVEDAVAILAGLIRDA